MTGGMKREAMFANGAVGVQLKCGKCERGKTCGIYPKTHYTKTYGARSQWCSHCKRRTSFYTKKELKDKKKHNLKHKKGKQFQIAFNYSKYGLTGDCQCADCTQS